MRARRMLIVFLVVSLLCSCALAEGRNDASFGSIGGWFGEFMDDASQWTTNAWNDASSWIEDKWADGSDWIESVWNDTSSWAGKIWGNISEQVAETYSSVHEEVRLWMNDMLSKYSKTKENAWEWIASEGDKLRSALIQTYSKSGVADARQTIQDKYDEILKSINLEDADISKVLESIKAYADEKGISVSSVKEILLPYLYQMADDIGTTSDKPIPAFMVAQYLTSIFEKLKINTEEEASGIIVSLKIELGVN